MNLFTHLTNIDSFKISHDEKYIAIKSNTTLFIYEMDDNSLIYSIPTKAVIIEFDFSIENSSKLALVLLEESKHQLQEKSNIILVIDLKKKEIVANSKLDEKIDRVTSLAYYKNNKILLGVLYKKRSTDEHTIRILDEELSYTGVGYKFPSIETINQKIPHRDFPKKISYNSTLDYIIVQGFFASIVFNLDGIIVWDEIDYIFNKNNINIQEISSYDSVDISLSADSNYLAIAFNGNFDNLSEKVFVYNLKKEEEVGWFISGYSAIRKIKISMQGNFLLGITESDNKSVGVYCNIHNKKQYELENCHDAVFSSIIENKIFFNQNHVLKEYFLD